ncbi:MAG: AAA family ATPase [Cellulosilyticaceae bacterium]
MEKMQGTERLITCIEESIALAYSMQQVYVTPEHMLYILCNKGYFRKVLEALDADADRIKSQIEDYFEQYMDKEEAVEPIESAAFIAILNYAVKQAQSSEKNCVDIQHVLNGIFAFPDSFAAYYLAEEGVEKSALLYSMCHDEEDDSVGEESSQASEEHPEKREWQKYATHLNQFVKDHPEPFVERDTIIWRTLEVLCRKTKNNPIHIGEPGVGKTALTFSLAKRIVEGEVPEKLKGANLFMLDLGGMLAGTQYRGDFEKRIKQVLESIKAYEKPIVYIDEIHQIVGAGALGNGAMDASNLLKPYLLENSIRFIGATTFEEYKKYFEKDKGLVRRFQTVEVKEPTVEECLSILKGLQESYEAHHGVTYTAEALEAAVTLSHKYMNECFLPDKAIDLIDEAGAYLALQAGNKKQVVTREVIETLLAKMCHVPKKTVASNEVAKLKTLEKRLKKQIFGQDHAIEEVTKYLKLSRAGLSEGDKPIASLLFVGPTGVGKTEIAKTLAEELGIKLIRFDMSEYGEKHTASKLIGSPPGYVGYEEGGLLTDAIRKTPHAVLLLDEIEKAHSDVFNMLLQVMDYATLTDSHGKKADFRNVILIMTSNAGARFIGKQLVGFGERELKETVMEDEVKKVFTPEFRNRLSGMIAFNHLSEEMANKIADKELGKLKQLLEPKNITLKCSKQCLQKIGMKGISKEFGARGIKRVIEGEIKPLLVEEMLFGKLQKGGLCRVVMADEHITIEIESKK